MPDLRRRVGAFEKVNVPAWGCFCGWWGGFFWGGGAGGQIVLSAAGNHLLFPTRPGALRSFLKIVALKRKKREEGPSRTAIIKCTSYSRGEKIGQQKNGMLYLLGGGKEKRGNESSVSPTEVPRMRELDSLICNPDLKTLVHSLPGEGGGGKGGGRGGCHSSSLAACNDLYRGYPADFRPISAPHTEKNEEALLCKGNSRLIYSIDD